MQVQICFRLPKELKERMDRQVERGAFLNESDFLREAVRDLVQKNERNGVAAKSGAG